MDNNAIMGAIKVKDGIFIGDEHSSKVQLLNLTLRT